MTTKLAIRVEYRTVCIYENYETSNQITAAMRLLVDYLFILMTSYSWVSLIVNVSKISTLRKSYY